MEVGSKCCLLHADIEEAAPQSHSSQTNTAAIVGGTLGGLLGILLLGLLVCFLLLWQRRRRNGGGDYGQQADSKTGKVPGGGPGSPALGVPVFFASKRDGDDEPSTGKQPPSPIKGFTEVRFPVCPPPSAHSSWKEEQWK